MLRQAYLGFVPRVSFETLSSLMFVSGEYGIWVGVLALKTP